MLHRFRCGAGRCAPWLPLGCLWDSDRAIMAASDSLAPANHAGSPRSSARRGGWRFGEARAVEACTRIDRRGGDCESIFLPHCRAADLAGVTPGRRGGRGVAVASVHCGVRAGKPGTRERVSVRVGDGLGQQRLQGGACPQGDCAITHWIWRFSAAKVWSCRRMISIPRRLTFDSQGQFPDGKLLLGIGAAKPGSAGVRLISVA